ncbi:MAG: hypothetical protein IH594_01355 [Bacteroidales bacterium]|nr:hypothetical protein [Bacteroidales bacterium]
MISLSCSVKQGTEDLLDEGIGISTSHPSYWSYKGENVLLLGGSIEDNLFQVPGLEEELKKLRSVGGNYVRNTMSSRDEGNYWPFEKNENGFYDLNRFNEDYWERFSNFLFKTHEYGIFVQIEIWATFDFYRDNWEVNPFNPNQSTGTTQPFTLLFRAASMIFMTLAAS